MDSAKTKEYYTGLKRHTALVLERISGADVSGDIERIELQLLKMLPPQEYGGAEGEEVQMIKAYERACAIMRQHQSKDPKMMTVLEFYETLESMKDAGKKYNKQLNGEPN